MADQPIEQPEVDVLPLCHILENQGSDSLARAKAIGELWELSCRSPIYAVTIGKMALKLVIAHCRHGEYIVKYNAVHCLWNLSAYEENKPKVVEEGAIPVLCGLLLPSSLGSLEKSQQQKLTSAAVSILQNISESRFRSGTANLQQVRIVQEGVVDALWKVLTQPDLPPTDRWKICLTFANLSMHPQNVEKMKSINAFQHIQQCILEHGSSLWNSDIWSSWLCLQPFVPLLHSPFIEVKLLATFSLARFTMNAERYHHKFFRDVSLNGGIDIVVRLTKLADRTYVNGVSLEEKIRQYATLILENVKLNYDRNPILIPDSTLQTDMKSLFIGGDYADFHVIVQGKVIPCHKAILFARCPYFRAFILHWSRSSLTIASKNTNTNTDTDTDTNTNTNNTSNQNRSEVDDREIRPIEAHTLEGLDYNAVKAAIEFIYSDFVQLTWDNAIDVLGNVLSLSFGRFQNVRDLKQKKNIFYYEESIPSIFLLY
jgi:hypothetical protein